MSSTRTEATKIANRYGAAIFSLACEAKSESLVVHEFASLAEAIRTHAPLAQALASPLLSVAVKSETLATLCAKANPLTTRATIAIANCGRAALIPLVADDLRTRLSAHLGEAEATITSARPLSAPTQKQLAQSLADATGKAVRLHLKEDANLLGGVLIELGSLRLDATLAGALSGMRYELLASSN